MRIRQGSTIVQYIIILCIIACVVTVGYLTLGTTITNILSGYNNSYKELSDNAKDNLASTNNISHIVGDTTVFTNEDGSATFSVDGQTVSLSPEVMNSMNEFIETSGSSGTTTLVDEVASMLNKYKDNYKEEEIPLEITFGTGTRSLSTSEPLFTEVTKDETANAIAIKIGDKITMLQKDETAVASETTPGFTKIEGTVTTDGELITIKDETIKEVVK